MGVASSLRDNVSQQCQRAQRPETKTIATSKLRTNGLAEKIATDFRATVPNGGISVPVKKTTKATKAVKAKKVVRAKKATKKVAAKKSAKATKAKKSSKVVARPKAKKTTKVAKASRAKKTGATVERRAATVAAPRPANSHLETISGLVRRHTAAARRAPTRAPGRAATTRADATTRETAFVWSRLWT
jgi:hypothetical protein